MSRRGRSAPRSAASPAASTAATARWPPHTWPFPSPPPPAKERRRLVAACFRHFGGALFDLISSERFDPVEICRRFSYEGWEHLDHAERLGRGVFLLGAHHGYWEISGRPIGLYRGVLHTVARPADNPYLERELSPLRRALGYAVPPKRGAARRMLQVVRAGGLVGILPDQRVQEREGILVPFFGHPALTTPVLARLSLRDGCPVVPVFAYPQPGGRYRMVIRPPILPEEAADAGEGAGGAGGEGAHDDDASAFGEGAGTAVAALTRRYLEAIEREIRDHPEMWLWMHRRWDRPGAQRARPVTEPQST